MAFAVFAIVVIYRAVLPTYFFEDDFGWISSAWAYSPTNWLHVAHYSHFYRPVIELYFFVVERLFGCAPIPFHVVSLGVHLVNTLLLFLVARQLSERLLFSVVTAAVFVVQPGYAQAVAWISAISDLLAALPYFLTLLLYAVFLHRHSRPVYWIAVAAFATCLLTHESSATLLPVMILMDLTGVVGGARERHRASLWRTALRYAPFAALLIGYLLISFVVNSRSYVVREGHWAIGWHVVPHMVQYLISLLVWENSTTAYVTIPIVVAALLLLGTPRARFAVLWTLVALIPGSFFTWGNVSRYLYIPAAGFALLLAEGTLTAHDIANRWWSPRVARALVSVVVIFLIVRSAIFAHRAVADFAEQTRPYERFARALVDQNPLPLTGAIVQIDRGQAVTLPVPLDLMAQVVYCRPDLHVVVQD